MLGPGQAKLVKWKSSNDEDYNFVIPISAAAVSISGKSILFFLSKSLVITKCNENRNNFSLCWFPSVNLKSNDGHWQK